MLRTNRLRMGGSRRAAIVAGALLTPLLLVGCAPEGITSQGREIQRLYNVFMVAAAGVFTLVTWLIVWSLIRYRRRGDELPKQVHGNNRLELLWTIPPAILVVVLFQQTIFCGLDHAHMTFDVRVVSPTEYQQWLTSQGAAGTAG